MAANPVEDGSPRLLGFWSCLALVVGTLVGSGIYLLPAQLAPFGWNAMAGWLVTIGGALCLAFVFARLAHALPTAAGPYAFVETAFGRTAAFAIGWSYWASVWIGNAAIAVAAVSYLSALAPALAEDGGTGAAAAILILWLLTWLNCLSLRASGAVQLVTTILKLVPLIAVVLIAALLVAAPGGTAAVPPLTAGDIDIHEINQAAALALWAMLGIETAAWASRNVRDPGRNVPRATLGGTLVVGLLYLSVSAAVGLLLPAAEVAASNAPLALFVERVWSGNAGLVLAVFAAVSVIGALNGLILLQGELPLAMARDGAFPPWFGKVSGRGRPVRAILVSSLLTSLLILANASRTLGGLFTFMALLGTAAALVLYFTVALAALRLQHRRLVVPTAALLTTASIGTLYALWTFWGAGAEAMGWTLVLMAAGLPVLLLARRQSRAARLGEADH